ncbi:MAG: DUF5696 domain-containing protein [Planctomycetia bacterium]|nr:DUF5696 domain-containing protein [Planctomycetia bacterium]
MNRFRIFLAGLFFLGSWGNAADLEVKITLKHGDGKLETRMVPLKQEGNVQYLRLAAKDLPTGMWSMEIRHPHATAKAGEEGFYVFRSGMYGTFQERPDGEYRDGNCVMPVFGVRTPRAAMTAITTGMRYEQVPIVRVKDGNYEIFQRFNINQNPIYEDIAVEYHQAAPDATYADLARIYRNYQLQKGVVRPLKERIQGNPELQYAAESMEIRVRLGWKPAPSPVEDQNAENEPPMKVAISFARIDQIIDEFLRQGIRKGQICLVGWNVRGHDGRWPQAFPVEESLGGEAGLRKTIAKAQKEGFQIVCHTNNTGAYKASQIGGLWDENYLLRNRKGELVPYKTTWSGGTAYQTCPKCMYERFVEEDYARLKELGFRGLHYVDVFSTVDPRTCYSPEHPLTKEDFARWTKKIFATAQKTFGGLGSEGGYDYAIENMDSALYLSYYVPGKPTHPMIDRHTPFWQLVYSGIVLSNPYTQCANYTLKDPIIRLKLIEFGGRPVFYFYSKFRDDGTWMGEADLTCATDEELVASVKAIRQGYEEFEKLKHLQYEFMEGHDEIAPDIFRTTFSDGTSILTNYTDKPHDWNGRSIPAMGYLVVQP